MVIPWVGVPLSRILARAEPTPNAKWVGEAGRHETLPFNGCGEQVALAWRGDQSRNRGCGVTPSVGA